MMWNRRQFVHASIAGLLRPVGHASYSFARGPAQSTRGASARLGEFGFRRRVESIDWYCEQRGRGPTIVLIPSGEGDCGSFDRVAALLSRDFTVLTFDMPGFSRSSDPLDFANYSMTRAANEVAALVRTLGMAPATFYGCSSGGKIGLSLSVDHPDVVRNVTVHEVAGVPSGESPVGDIVRKLANAGDEEIVRACKDLFRNQLNENAEAWDSLGEAFHARLERNYVTWVRRYVGHLGTAPTPEELRGRPVVWTIGALTYAGSVSGNVVLAQAAGLRVGLLRCRSGSLSTTSSTSVVVVGVAIASIVSTTAAARSPDQRNFVTSTRRTSATIAPDTATSIVPSVAISMMRPGLPPNTKAETYTLESSVARVTVAVRPGTRR